MNRNTALTIFLVLAALAAPAGARRETLAGAIAEALTHRPVDPSAPVVAGFSPGVDGYRAEDVVLQAITEARTSIHLAAYSFTSKPIAAALVEAKRRGLEVAIVADRKANSRSYTAATFAANQGVPVRLDDHYAIMHNKFMVVDGREVETGSFNYTAAAARSNAENALLLRGVPQLAATYEREWQRLWAESDPLAPRY